MEERQVLKKGYDPKNREVLYIAGRRNNQNVWQIEKPETQFISRVTNSQKIADEVFIEQISCSQN
ncbi:MAG: hypothetical protein M0R21_12410 [Lentimicrobiaceae bacterium]|jgi:hypothetical protein|nr:hypothetical protein [Lentimicrobiaceae bacterium]